MPELTIQDIFERLQVWSPWPAAIPYNYALASLIYACRPRGNGRGV